MSYFVLLNMSIKFNDVFLNYIFAHTLYPKVKALSRFNSSHSLKICKLCYFNHNFKLQLLKKYLHFTKTVEKKQHEILCSSIRKQGVTQLIITIANVPNMHSTFYTNKPH